MKIYKPKPHKIRSNETRVVRVKTETYGMAALKTLIVMSLIFSQLALLIYLYIELAMAFRWYLVFSFVMSLITSIYVLSSNKNSLSKAVWILFILVFFVFGYAIYIISDERFFFNRAKRRYNVVFENSKKHITEEYREIKAEKSVSATSRLLYNSAGFRSFKNTRLEYFSSGARFFDDFLERLKGAEKFVFMEFFIVSDGVLMNRFIDIIEEKIKHGVDVRIIYDDMGSHKSLSRKTKKRLKEIGVKLLPFNRLIPFFQVGLNYRDHRKIAVIDGVAAYTGGVNFADEYINEKRLFGYWKDSGVGIFGEATDALTLAFLCQWEFLSRSSEDYSPFLNRSESEPSDFLVAPFFDGLDYDAPVSKSVYESLIAAAEERIYIMTPYFIPDDTIKTLLKNKAQSGVEVRIILPGIPDKSVVYGVSRTNAEKLIPYGVKLYCMKDSFVHSKIVLNEKSVVIGSVNMDLRSFYQQFESALFTNDEKILSAVLFDFHETFRDSCLISEGNGKKRNILHRIFSGVLQLFAPFM